MYRTNSKIFSSVVWLYLIVFSLLVSSSNVLYSMTHTERDTTTATSSYGKYYIALKSNLLYDAVGAFNAECEFPIGERFSVMVEDVFPWWRFGPNHGRKYAFQMVELGVEPRFWFPSKKYVSPLKGHFIGLYGMSAIYDFQWNRDGGYQGEYWSVGITYGYALPISKFFNMEFSLGIGYLFSDYRHYLPGQDYEALYVDKYNSGVLNYVGPTKLKVSLVWPIPIKYKIKR